MKRISILALALALSVVSGALTAAQLYRWVDENGRIEWRDTPPPPSAKNVEERRIGVGSSDASSLPYSVQQAMKNFPVTLWATGCGAPCSDARALLARRGVPYTEKDPTRDIESFKKLTGGLDVPVLSVGNSLIKGYLTSEWDAALDNAGYPRTAIPTYGAKPAAETKSETPPADQPEGQSPAQPGGQPVGQSY